MHRLPTELVDLVMAHRAAMAVQARWRRYSRYGHARHRIWPTVREHLWRIGAWPDLAAYSGVRREWRAEPGSWLVADAVVTFGIRNEARDGMWGPRTLAVTAGSHRRCTRIM